MFFWNKFILVQTLIMKETLKHNLRFVQVELLFVMSLREVHTTKHKMICSHFSQLLFSNVIYQQSVGTDKQLTMTTMPMMIEVTL
jgi:hypothetical protein